MIYTILQYFKQNITPTNKKSDNFNVSQLNVQSNLSLFDNKSVGDSHIKNNPLVRQAINFYVKNIFNARVVGSKSLISLLEQPNFFDTKYSLIDKIVTNLFLYGNAYIEPTFSNKKLTNLYVLDSSEVSLIQSSNKTTKEITNVEIQYKGKSTDYSKIIHLKRNISFENHQLQGTFSIKYLSNLIANLENAENCLNQKLKLNVSLKGALTRETESNYNTGSDISHSYNKAVKAQINATFSNASTYIVDVPAGFKFNEFKENTDSKEINSYIQLIKALRERIGDFFGVDIEKIHNLNEENHNLLLNNTINPILKQISSGFSKINVEIKFLPSYYLNEKDFNKKLIDNVKSGLLTINESRAKLGLKPVKGGDKIRVSLNEVSLDLVDEYQANMSAKKKEE